MKKTLIIISREYFVRVRKKSFLLMTLLGPLLLALFIVIPVYINIQSQKNMKVLVVDDNDYYINRFEDTRTVSFSYLSGDIDELKLRCVDSEYDAVLHILGGNQSNRSNLYYHDDISLSIKADIESQMDKLIFDKVLQDSFNIKPAEFEHLKEVSKSAVTMLQIDETGTAKERFTEMNRIVGLVCGFLIYTFIFMYASQVLRSVLEEKTNRIVEVLISSVKPLQLMLGKIVGVALVGLTQVAAWILLTLLLLGAVQVAAPDIFTPTSDDVAVYAAADNNTMVTEESIANLQSTNILNEIGNFYSVSFGTLIFSFLFFFIFGYLVYASLFAAVGSAVDNETDSQQFTLPVTLPLLLTIVCVYPIAEAPDGALAWWFSMIPFTSPVAMLVRLPSGVSILELVSSMVIVAAFFVFCLWFASKIYRTGILMYGKKVTYRDLWRWVKVK